MRTAVRVDENPALNAAMEIANRLGLPVLIYHELSERYPYASDRHHTFILEGARDVQAPPLSGRLATLSIWKEQGTAATIYRTLSSEPPS